jgi:hypothetical protein
MGDQMVVVTVAGAGPVRAIVRRFARPGVSIGLLARGVERLQRAAAARSTASASATSQMPAMNTPLDRVKSRLPQRARPPLHRPWVAAGAGVAALAPAACIAE